MSLGRTRGAVFLLIPVLLLLQTGCASRVPATLPLPGSTKPFVLDQIRQFQNRQCSRSLDADITMEWRGYGKAQKIPGMLQLQQPSSLRYSIVDPLGRQLVIMVSNGEHFTLVNNRKAAALTGPVDSPFLREYIPAYLQPENYLSWLTGRFPATGFEVSAMRRDSASPDGVWLISKRDDGYRHRILFLPEEGRVARHLIEGQAEDILFDVTYAASMQDQERCPLPRQLTAEGEDITGTVTITFKDFQPESPIPEKFFHLTIPNHFTVTIVD